MKFKVLVVHNAYQQRGGEDAVVDAELELLASHGHSVRLYSRHNDELRGQSAGQVLRQTLWSSRTVRELAQLLRNDRPDVVHVHNTLPLVSPSVYWAAAAAGVPVVQTLHNFRLLCPQALLLRDNLPCESCVGKAIPWPGIQHACYRQSRIQTAVVAGTVALHRGLGTWRNKVAAYIALNDFARDKFIQGGVPAERLHVKPNFIDLPAPIECAREHALFVGRLSEEKGIRTLVATAARLPAGARLRVIGDGPLRPLVAGAPGIDYLGSQPQDQVHDWMRRSGALVLPSICYENFPRTLVEAFACGLPVLSSRLGAMPGIIQEGVTGWLETPGDADAFAARLAHILSQVQASRAVGRAARLDYEARFTGPRNVQMLSDIYGSALSRSGLAIGTVGTVGKRQE
ncbi:MAG: glycosyltransferase family 4 protein [Burkholderiaceae bacterium]|nr:glycosyltransferase family 4 protein [Roseateles sp.]MBV8468238.1 glycosyltransferase family 4 protein [Burkholderiaceae bacterium]